MKYNIAYLWSSLQIHSLESKIQHKDQQTNTSCSSISRFSLTFIEGIRHFQHGYGCSNDKTESNKKENSSRTIPHGSGKSSYSFAD